MQPDRIRGALWGMYIGDALAMPVHWYYDISQLKKGNIYNYSIQKISWTIIRNVNFFINKNKKNSYKFYNFYNYLKNFLSII